MLKRFLSLMVFLVVFIPLYAIAQEVAVDPTSGVLVKLVAWVQSQSWYTVAFVVIGAANSISMWVSDEWAEKYPVLKQINTGLNWLSANLFRNTNAKKVK